MSKDSLKLVSTFPIERDETKRMSKLYIDSANFRGRARRCGTCSHDRHRDRDLGSLVFIVSKLSERPSPIDVRPSISFSLTCMLSSPYLTTCGELRNLFAQTLLGLVKENV